MVKRHVRRPVAALGGVMLLTSGLAGAQDAPAFAVDGKVALHSLASLSDAHLQKLADILTVIAASDNAQTATWERIRPSLVEAARMTVPAVLWFAGPDGSYWTVTQGRIDATLADRPYFPRLLAGQSVVGDLVVSRSTNRNSAIVAVPIRGRHGTIVGVLGGSVHLDSLATIVRKEMGGVDAPFIFYAIGPGGLGALNSDPSLIFTEPMKLGDEGMRRAFSEILAGQHGTVTYTFRGTRRTVLYQRSSVSGWWYGFGVAKPEG